MTIKELITSNMLIHGHDTDIKILEISEKLVALAEMLANDEELRRVEYKATVLEPKLVLRDVKVFFREKFILHNVSYADELMLKFKLNKHINFIQYIDQGDIVFGKNGLYDLNVEIQMDIIHYVPNYFIHNILFNDYDDVVRNIEFSFSTEKL